MCLGHESSGVVTSISPDASTTLQVGDRVALEVGLPCRLCPLCKSGRYNICPNLIFKSSAKVFPHADGTLTELMNHPADLCHKLPDNVTFEQGALVEPLAVTLHAVRRSSPGDLAGGTALVLGAGAIGLLTAAALSVHGLATIIVADIDAARLSLAATHLAHLNVHTYKIPTDGPNPATLSTEDALAASSTLATAIKASHPSIPALGFDRIYECTGVTSCVQTGIYAAAPGGKLILVGMGKPVHTLPIAAAALREVDIIGVFRYAGEYPAAIRLWESGKLKGVDDLLVTHRVSLEQGKEGFELARKGKDGEGRPVVKVIIESSGGKTA